MTKYTVIATIQNPKTPPSRAWICYGMLKMGHLQYHLYADGMTKEACQKLFMAKVKLTIPQNTQCDINFRSLKVK